MTIFRLHLSVSHKKAECYNFVFFFWKLGLRTKQKDLIWDGGENFHLWVEISGKFLASPISSRLHLKKSAK